MKTVELPKRKVHKTPRLLLGDAYTIGSNGFESEDAREKSTYYITFRRKLHTVNPDLYEKGNDKIVVTGLQRILDKLFYEPITHAEIDETKRFLKHAKVTTKGFTEYQFPEELWRRVVDEYNGRPPIEILAMPEGSVVYPNEPVVQITSIPDGFGILAAWFESKLLQMWAATERVTQNEHWFAYLKQMVRSVEPDLSDDMVAFYAAIMLHDFGDRAGITKEESEELGMAHLYTFPGTDTFSGAYQAFMNCDGNSMGLFSSVSALAHRNVQAFENEGDCELLSNVADCYDFEYAVENYLLPLAKESVEKGNGKVIVARPDSNDALKQVLWVCRLAVKHGLYTEKVINGKTWKFATTLHFIEGDGMTHKRMKEIIQALLDEGFVPYSWGLFGVGGGLRNSLKRDNLSGKYALCAVSNEDKGVVKYGMVGKTTLPGPFKVLRSPEALAKKTTIVKPDEDGENAMVEYFNGARIWKPFGIGQDDDFIVIKNRIREQFDSMPNSLETETNGNYPASQEILNQRIDLLYKYQSHNK